MLRLGAQSLEHRYRKICQIQKIVLLGAKTCQKTCFKFQSLCVLCSIRRSGGTVCTQIISSSHLCYIRTHTNYLCVKRSLFFEQKPSSSRISMHTITDYENKMAVLLSGFLSSCQHHKCSFITYYLSCMNLR